MKRPPNLTWLTLIGVVSLWLLFPAEARADAINMEAVAVAGIVVLVPLMAFEVFVEAVILAVGLKFPYRKVLLLSLGANLASLAAGIPVKIFNAWMYPNILPHELAPYFKALPRAVLLGTMIYYVDGESGNLCSIGTDGQGRRVLAPDAVKDYQFRSDRGWFLYRNGSHDLCLFRDSGEPVVCWKTDQRFRMEQVTCNPDGTVVAYLSRVGDLKPFELVLYDVGSGRTLRTGVTTHKDSYEPEVAWSDSPDLLFLMDAGKVQAYRVGKDLSVAPSSIEPAARRLLTVYGRLKNEGYWWGGDDWGATFSHDVCGGQEATAYYGLESHLRVKRDDAETFVLADNPGLLHLPSRDFGDVCFLGNDNELVFDDHRDIYLLDVNQRKVGWITHGSKAVTLTARYQRKIVDAKK